MVRCTPTSIQAITSLSTITIKFLNIPQKTLANNQGSLSVPMNCTRKNIYLLPICFLNMMNKEEKKKNENSKRLVFNLTICTRNRITNISIIEILFDYTMYLHSGVPIDQNDYKMK